MDMIRYSWLFFRRQMDATLRLPGSFFLSCFHPFVWMLLFGSLFRALASMRGFEEGSYVQFLAPGIAVMSALFGATYSGLGLLGDIHSGLLDKFLAAPVPRIAIVTGPLLSTGLATTLQAAIILLTALAMGARPQGGVAGITVLFVTVALLGGTVSAFSNSLALITRTQRTMISIVNFISLPLVFLSTMMITAELMPSWMRSVSYFNPVNWAVTVSRAAFNGHLDYPSLRPLMLLAALGVASWGLTVWSLHRYQQSV